MAMAVPDTTKCKGTTPKKKEYDYDEIKLSLENCIMPPEMLDETPSMKDGLHRDVENELRRFGCELIQVSGLLLKLPQVAMATGQVILQRFYYIKSMVHHDMETNAMAAIFLAAKIEECPRRLRDIINVCDHIKQKTLKKAEVPAPMDYFGTQYFNIKNNVIKAERRILKELGFCVHVKHPHKVIITYLQILEHEKNVALARSAWNFMNDSLRTDVFVRFSPDIIACACIFLAARTVKVNLPMKPPWWLLFDASYDDIEDISLSILRLYSHKSTKITHLEAVIKKLKKEKKENPDKNTPNDVDSFTPSHTPNSVTAHVIQTNNSENNSKPSSKSTSPVEKEKEKQEKRSSMNSVINYKKMKTDSDNAYERERERDLNKRKTQQKSDNNVRNRFNYSSEESSDSEQELPSKKYEKQREQYETNKKRHPASSGSDTEPVSKIDRNSPNNENRRSKHKDKKERVKEHRPEIKESNGRYDKVYDNFPKTKRSRSQSPGKRGRSVSPKRKAKYQNEKNKDKIQSKVRYTDKYPNWR